MITGQRPIGRRQALWPYFRDAGLTLWLGNGEQAGMYRSVTRNIEVAVEPFFLAEQSSPAESNYVWAYRVTIANHSDQPIQLLSRYWRITDERGHVEEVRGPGGVGEQPRLDPGDSFQYMSGCPLRTPSGFMVGTYTIRSKDELFEIDIPAFSLDLPGTTHSLN